MGAEPQGEANGGAVLALSPEKKGARATGRVFDGG